MKKWTEYGAEHSVHLKVIAEFKDEADLQKAFKEIDELRLHSEEGADKPARGTLVPDFQEVLYKNLVFCSSGYELMSILEDIEVEQKGKTIEIVSREPMPSLWEYLSYNAKKVTIINGDIDE